MNSYRFTLIQKKGRKCYKIPGAVMERKYGLLEENNYVFFAAGIKKCQVINIIEHPAFKKRAGSRLAI